MARTKATPKPRTISGAAWAAATGQRPIGVTLTPAEHHGLGVLASQLGVRGKAEMCRRLVRWALAISAAGKEPKKIEKILALSIDSQE